MAKKKKKKRPLNRQKQQQKRAKKLKEKRKRLRRMMQDVLYPSLKQAATWPLHEVLISSTWKDPMELTQILVARRGPEGLYGVGSFLVDQACLGVKSAFGRVVDELEYRKFRSRMRETQELIPGDINLAAKIVREAVAYARSFGIQPDPDIKDALLMIRDADPDACQEAIPLGGIRGKPTFIAGPYDNIEKIIKTLEKHLGPDGFEVIVPLTSFGFGDEEDDAFWGPEDEEWSILDDEAPFEEES